MNRLLYILSTFLILTSCQHDVPMSVSNDPTAKVNFVMSRVAGGGYDGTVAYDPVADTLYLVAYMNGVSDTSIYTLQTTLGDTVYASQKPFLYEDVKDATFSIFGYGNVGYETAGRISPYPEMDQHESAVFERNNYVRTENLSISKKNPSLPMSASNHVLSATLHPQFTMVHVMLGTNGNDEIIDSVIILSDAGDIIPHVHGYNYRAIIDPSNVRPPLGLGESPNKDNAILKVVMTRPNTGEKYTLYAGYYTDTPISDYKGKKIQLGIGFVGENLEITSFIEPWELVTCSGTASYIRQ